MNDHALSLISGGLDSTLATILLVKLGVKVTALKFLTNFGCDIGEGSSCGYDPSSVASRFGFNLKLCHLGEDYIQMVKAPRHGYGRTMNPCIDCRIIMLKWAKDYMKEIDASFIATGELLGQRPMSQNKQTLKLIEKEAGLEGLILRPLSAKLLPQTMPEINGIVDRQKLLGIKGRSRKKQLELAKELGLQSEDYGQPAGGCLLTDPGFSRRLEDLWQHNPVADVNDINLLKLGRHFRTGPHCKIVVGRNQEENEAIEGLKTANDILLKCIEFPGPTTLIRGNFTDEDINIAYALTIRYSDKRNSSSLKLRIIRNSECDKTVDTRILQPLIESARHIV